MRSHKDLTLIYTPGEAVPTRHRRPLGDAILGLGPSGRGGVHPPGPSRWPVVVHRCSGPPLPLEADSNILSPRTPLGRGHGLLAARLCQPAKRVPRGMETFAPVVPGYNWSVAWRPFVKDFPLAPPASRSQCCLTEAPRDLRRSSRCSLKKPGRETPRITSAFTICLDWPHHGSEV